MVSVRNLRKKYKNHEVLRGIDFDIKSGELYAILGPNGAGKSTTLNILSTRLAGFRGEVTIDGLRLGLEDREIKKRLGVVFQEGLLDDALTVEENLRLRGGLYGLKSLPLHERIRRVSNITGIEEFLHRPYGRLSGGQRRRCDIARALLTFPKLLLLDEPTTGLDPKMRQELWDTIHSVREETDVTIILTTHYMEEATNANRIAIMKNGKIIIQGTPVQLKEQFSKDSLVLFSKQKDALKYILQYKGISYREIEQGVRIPLRTTKEAIPILESCRGRFQQFEVVRGNMEDVYLAVLEHWRTDV